MVGLETAIQIVVFRIGNERYALPTETAREVIGYSAPRRLPGAEAWVEGVINLRGEIIPICDLMIALGLPQCAHRNQVVICDVSKGSVGLVVEEVSSVLTVTADDITQPESMTHPALAGLVQRDNQLIVILDLDHALTDRSVDGETTVQSLVRSIGENDTDGEIKSLGEAA